VWHDAKDNGHALDERAATMVTGQAGMFFSCGPHSEAAFQKTMVIAGAEGKCRLHFPPVGDLAITRETKPGTTPSGTATIG
jgi:hypothetical protein